MTLSGDASGAQAAIVDAAKSLRILADEAQRTGKTSADETGKANAKWQEYANFAKAAARAVVDFGVDSVKAFAESERVSRQLQRAAGDLSDVFEKQADALSKQLAVDDDVIKQQQTLLLQWGAAPSKVEGATRAILDYAAATGKDAQGATMELIRAVETGGGKLKALGIDFVATGDKTKDLAALTEALSRKFGGAAQTDADSLVGSTRAAKQAFEDMQKAFGFFIAEAGQKTGVVNALTEAMRGLQTAMGGNESYNKNQKLGAIYDEMTTIQNALANKADTWTNGVDKSAAVARLKALAQQAKDMRAEPVLGDKPLSGSNTTAAAGSIRGASEDSDAAANRAKKNAEILRDEEKDYRKFLSDQEDAQRKSDDKRQAEDLRLLNEMTSERVRHENAEAKRTQDAYEAQTKETERRNELEKRALEQEWKERAAIVRQQQEAWRQAGDQLGAAMVNALSAQIENMAEGGEFDMGALLENVAIAAVSIAATAVGSYFGQPALGAAIGNLASMGIKYGAAEGRRKHHDGGWIEAERFHGGGWVGFDETPVIAQPGERMLSRAEVQRMGGGAAVDSMVAGGGGRGGVTINVSGFDAKSTREFFQDRGGQGFRRAVQSGRGDLARMFGNGVLF
jgi:hypothetical protein